MKRVLKGFIAIFMSALLVGPFLVPIPELTDTQPVTKLTYPDSHFAAVNGVQIHYQSRGTGEPAYVLLHGFAASTFSWREVRGPLSVRGQVLAYDRPAFGLTERPMKWGDWNPYGAAEQVDIALSLMDSLGIDRAIVIGNSAGGNVAAQLALRAPERVDALVLVSPAIGGGSNRFAWLRPMLRLPQLQRIGPLLIRSFGDTGMELGKLAWHDPNLITPEIEAGYALPLQAQNWDRALWHFVASSESDPALSAQLATLKVPILVITGDDDRVVPTAQSVVLANQIGAELVVITGCGHVPQEECPQQFIDTLDSFVANRGFARSPN